VARWLTAGLGLAAASYAAYVGLTWYRYGDAPRLTGADDQDALLDTFMPDYEIVERHRVQIAAPAEIALAAASEMDLQGSVISRGIFKARERILGADPDATVRPRGLLAFVTSLGWGVLAEIPGREIVMGAVTQPWLANVVFRALPPDEFAAFHEPDYVKIVWTLRADPLGPAESMFRTETRAVATDPVSRARFRRYWSFLSPGIILIRWVSLGPLKVEAERRARESSALKTDLGSPLRYVP
jgi:hypothetical protein